MSVTTTAILTTNGATVATLSAGQTGTESAGGGGSPLGLLLVLTKAS